MRETAPERQERLPRVAIRFVLPFGVLDILAGEPVLQLRREKRHAVEEQDEVETVPVVRAVAKLPHDGEYVGFIQPLDVGIEAAGRSEVREIESTT